MAQTTDLLGTTDHSREAAGLKYVYPVVSRRAGGVSVGINLNPNNACNWRCIYCQVPGLTRGASPAIDLDRLEGELRGFMRELLEGDFMARRVPPEARRLTDIAISGNGEPTSAREFAEVVERIGRVIADCALAGRIRLVLITNGSLMQRTTVQQGLRRMSGLDGEVWFKLDRATPAGIRLVNNTRTSVERVRQNLAIAAASCPTWIQTCVFALDGSPPGDTERAAYLGFLAGLRRDGITIRGVQLYGLARPSLQPEAPRLSRLPQAWTNALAADIAALGLPVKLTP